MHKCHEKPNKFLLAFHGFSMTWFRKYFIEISLYIFLKQYFAYLLWPVHSSFLNFLVTQNPFLNSKPCSKTSKEARMRLYFLNLGAKLRSWIWGLRTRASTWRSLILTLSTRPEPSNFRTRPFYIDAWECIKETWICHWWIVMNEK